MPFITNSVLLNLYLKRISLGGDSLQRSNENVHKLKRIIKIKKKTIPEKVFKPTDFLGKRKSLDLSTFHFCDCAEVLRWNKL